MNTNGEPLRVLIIDDDEFHADTLAESLQRVGYECVVASTGRGAPTPNASIRKIVLGCHSDRL